MRKFFLATAAGLAVVATPAVARDGSGYIGVDGGVLLPQEPARQRLGRLHQSGRSGHHRPPRRHVKFKTGYDVDLNAGYDFGMFRLEGELGYKRATNKSRNLDHDVRLRGFNAGAGHRLHRRRLRPQRPHQRRSPAWSTPCRLRRRQRLRRLVGGGFGRARVKELGDSDSAWAWQLHRGVRTAISDNIDVGLKYRYFRTGKLNFNDDFAFTGVGMRKRRDRLLRRQRPLRSHSLLLSLVYNFAGAAAPPPPPPPPPAAAAAAAAPATQTCPDGSVILATTPARRRRHRRRRRRVERGERGR